MFQKRFTIIILSGICFIFAIAGISFSRQSHDHGKAGRHCIIKQRPLHHRKANTPLKNAGDCTMSRTIIKSEYWPGQTYTIPIVFHIIYKSNGTGNISDQRIKDQVKVLNQDYGAIAGSSGEKGFNTKIQFQLAGITRTVNDNWFDDRNEVQFKQALGWDQKRYLNVYVNSAGGYLGYSYLPQEDAGDVYDGVVVVYEAVGGRNNGYDYYDQGRTLVHEVGHYLGLLHTFEGYGCYEGYDSGDLIADTHSESDEHYDCRQTSTCGTPDDIHNYMNYTEDTCMYEFTPEQANRMICSIVNYRPLLYQTTGTGPGSQASITVTSPNGGESWTAGSSYTVKWTSGGTVGNVKIQYSANNGSKWTTVTSSTANDGNYNWTVPDTGSSQCLVRIREAADGSPSDTSDAVFSIVNRTSPSPPPPSSSSGIALNRTALYFGAAGTGVVTGPQQLWLNPAGNGTINWRVGVDKWWINCSPGSGTNSGVLTVFVNPAGLSPGNYSGAVTITDAGGTKTLETVTVYLGVKRAYQDRQPFGSFSTPVDGSVVRGSVPITGWVLDDVEVKSIKIYREAGNGSFYVGDAVFVEGARPDVEAAYPGYPRSHMAGWGYMMLTNFLPDGIHVINVFALDGAGNRVNLGSSTIFIDNAGVVKPFGAIDRPAQGGIASGRNYRNQGWVLAPPPNKIPVNGSTIEVYIDGKFIGNPTYNIYRKDIADAFPGYANSNGALAFLDIDTTVFANGVHSIQWVVKDKAGNTDGIGSRYFIIQNSGSPH